jgi:biotin-dependent carboxylase-like uncharacterized protein
MIEILSNGALNSIQDCGRSAHLGSGVCISGVMDRPAMALANLMLGNPADAAGIEVTIFPLRIKVHSDLWLTCTGATAPVTVGSRTYASWWLVQARSGDVITIGPPQIGSRVFLAVCGGFDVPLLLGSRSTDLKSGFGGVEGRGLRKGDQIKVMAHEADPGARSIGLAPASRMRYANELAENVVRVRAMAAAEYREFSDAARSALTSTDYKLTSDCNRQGYRLEGEKLGLVRPLELLSHPVVPGVVQVPPSGQPIVQMAEANTIGGYPKIACVIEADLWRLAQLRPGQRVRFELVDHSAAVDASRELETEINRLDQALDLVAKRPLKIGTSS